MEELQGLFSLFQMPVTAYGLCVALAAGAGLLVFSLLARKKAISEKALMTFSLLCLPLGLLGARMFYCLARLDLFLAMGIGSVLHMANGGYALWGGIGGAVLAALIAARIGRVPTGMMLDCVAAPGALTVALIRFAEYFSGEGYGLYVENEVFQFFPLAVSKFGDWRWAVFMLEGAAALLIFIAVFLYRQKRPGDRMRAALILFCASQIILESLRQDSFLRWEVHFIRLSELPAVFLLAALPVAAAIRGVKRGRGMRMATAGVYGAVFLASVGVFIWMEFAVQKSPDLPVWACYCIEAACCAAMGYISWRMTMKD